MTDCSLESYGGINPLFPNLLFVRTLLPQQENETRALAFSKQVPSLKALATTQQVSLKSLLIVRFLWNALSGTL